MANIAGVVDDNQGTGSIPSFISTSFTGPTLSLKIDFHTTDITTGVVIIGTNQRTLKNLRAAMPRQAIRAMEKPRTYCIATVKKDKGMRRIIASQNLSFETMSVQLRPPTQLKPAFATDQLEKVNAIVKNKGKMMMARRVSKPGIRNSRP
tara:strand:- start:2021 stop:2470 length:450 start_codon:yes stop_codon:yes gene_type:complete